MDETTIKVLFLLLGWLFGLLSPVIVDAIKRRRLSQESKIALRIELMELRYRLATTIFQLESKYGDVTRDLLEWLKPIVENYQGLNPSENTLKSIELLLSDFDERIGEFQRQLRAPSNDAPMLQKITLPLLEARFPLISGFEHRLHNQLLELKAHLNMLNDYVDQARFYHQLTFSPGISNSNFDTAQQNLFDACKEYLYRARIMVDQISAINW